MNSGPLKNTLEAIRNLKKDSKQSPRAIKHDLAGERKAHILNHLLKIPQNRSGIGKKLYKIAPKSILAELG